MAVDVLQYHDRVVNQNPNRQRQPEHDHHVHREAGEVDRYEGGHDGCGDRYCDYEGSPDVVKEEEDYEYREKRAQPERRIDVCKRLLGLVGLIERHGYLDILRQHVLHVLQLRLDRVGYPARCSRPTA